MPQYIIACKELDGQVFITRLGPTQPVAGGGYAPGTPDPWHFVGPGSRPSVTEYNGTQFIITFDYLSHLFTRVFDITTWPPTQVNPVQISGGPNPPTPFTYNIQLSQDSLSLNIGSDSGSAFGIVAPFFNPPTLQQPILFLDASTNTYSVTILPKSTYAPQPPAGVQVFYRFYVRPFPYTGPWILTQDWTLSAVSQPWFSFPFSSVGSLRDQFSVTWGSQFDPLAPWDPTRHAEGIPGEIFVTVDSTVTHPSYQFFLNESLTIDLDSYVVAPNFGNREDFVSEGPFDAIELSISLLEQGSGNTFAFFGTRQAFVDEVGSDSINALYLLSNPAAFVGGNALRAVMG